MSRSEIWRAYRKCQMDYETALNKLIADGMTPGRADDLLARKLEGEDDGDK